MSKCSLDWNLLQNALKTNLKKIKHSEIKTQPLSQKTFLINIQSNNNNNNNNNNKKQQQINSTPYTSILLHCLLSFPMSFLSLSPSIFLFLSTSSFLSFLLPFLVFNHTRTRSDLKSCVLISLEFGR